MPVLEKPDRLTEREKRFCAVFARTGNRISSYKEAGYKCDKDGNPSKHAPIYISGILKRERVRREIERIQKEIQERRIAKEEFSVDFIRNKHVEMIDKSLAAGDLTNATRNLEALGKMIGAYTDNVSRVDATVRREWTDEELVVMNRIADAMTLGVASEPFIDAQVIESRGQPALPTIPE